MAKFVRFTIPETEWAGGSSIWVNPERVAYVQPNEPNTTTPKATCSICLDDGIWTPRVLGDGPTVIEKLEDARRG